LTTEKGTKKWWQNYKFTAISFYTMTLIAQPWKSVIVHYPLSIYSLSKTTVKYFITRGVLEPVSTSSANKIHPGISFGLIN
jgi:hypothetical protein